MHNSIPVRKRLGFKISLMIAVIILTGIGLVEVVIYRNETRHRERLERMQLAEIEGELRQKAHFSAVVLAAGGAEALLTYNFMVLDDFAKSLARDPDILEIVFRDAKGKAVSRYNREAAGADTAAIIAEQPIKAGAYSVGKVRVSVGTKRIAAAAASMGTIAGERRRETVILFLAVAGILSAGVMGGVMLAVNRTVVRPLRVMARHMEAAPSGVVMDRPAAHVDDEIGHLVTTYNSMSQSMVNYERELKAKVAELEKSRGDLASLNEALEQRVADRTMKLQEASEEIKSFAYIVSHDLRAPLVSIKGFAKELSLAVRAISEALKGGSQTIRSDQAGSIGGLLDKDVPEAVAFIEASADRMDRLISSILTLSRAGRRELKPERVDMNALTRSILDSLAHQCEKHAISVGRLPEITADRLAMEQIMGNLLDNAFKYLDPGRPGVIEISGEELPGKTVVHVKDNGRGITAADIPKIFEIFKRAGRQDVPGEGIGLAYVRALVKRHNGQIGCESTPGTGSVFSFSVPHENAMS